MYHHAVWSGLVNHMLDFDCSLCFPVLHPKSSATIESCKVPQLLMFQGPACGRVSACSDKIFHIY